MVEQALGPGHPEVALHLNILGALNRLQCRFARAEAHHRHAIEIDEVAQGPDHLQLAEGLDGLGLVLQERGKHVEAGQAYLRAQAIFERTEGLVSSEVALVLSNRGELGEDQGLFEAAEALYLLAIVVREQVGDRDMAWWGLKTWPACSGTGAAGRRRRPFAGGGRGSGRGRSEVQGKAWTNAERRRGKTPPHLQGMAPADLPHRGW